MPRSVPAELADITFGPDDPRYAEQTAAYNLALEHTPECVVAVRAAADVAAAVRFAQVEGLPVSVQSTGHSDTSVRSGMLVSTKGLRGVSIDPIARTATVGAGETWGAVITAAAAHGLCPVVGASPVVGVVGYLLGGGLGPLVRSHGISSDYLVRARVVTGHGDILTVDADEHPDLFWALRGGDSGLGVVTELTVRLVELSTLYAGALTFLDPHIETVLRGWIDWTASADPQVTTSVAMVHYPPLEFVPPAMRGKFGIALRFAFPGSPTDGERLAAPLRALAPAEIDDLHERPVTEIDRIHGDPTQPSPSAVAGATLDRVDQQLATILLELYGPGNRGPFAAGEVRHLGSAAHTDVPEGSAVPGRSAGFVFNSVAPGPGATSPQTSAAIDTMHERLAPWTAAEANPNFLGMPRTPQRYARAWSPAVLTRLQSVRETYDPQGVFA